MDSRQKNLDTILTNTAFKGGDLLEVKIYCDDGNTRVGWFLTHAEVRRLGYHFKEIKRMVSTKTQVIIYERL